MSASPSPARFYTASPALVLVLALGTACIAADEPAPAASSADAVPAAAAAPTLIPADARLERVGELARDPHRDPLPADPKVADAIRLGFDLVRNTYELMPEYVGNRLTCGNCHLNAGQRDRALPLVGVATTFPQYRSRGDRLISLEDRIAGCFLRSMNGTPPPYGSPEMLAISAYIAWLSEGQPMYARPDWLGRNQIARENRIPIDRLDVRRGEQIYAQQCSSCHGTDGQGLDLGVARPGPLWGPGSWNDGAGAARIYTLAGFIRYAMPLFEPGALSDGDAQHVAAFINSHERPVFPSKERDFPRGDVPADAVYYPIYPRNPLMK